MPVRTSFNVESPTLSPRIEGEKIKSLSGQILTWCNQTKSVRCILNPNNEDCGPISQTFGKICRVVLRFFVGLAAGIIGGSVGTIRHLVIGLIASAWQMDAEDCKKHLKSGLADLGRALTGGLMPAIGYGFFPDLYFAKEDRRSDGVVQRNDSESPVQKEWAVVGGFLWCCLQVLATPFYWFQ